MPSLRCAESRSRHLPRSQNVTPQASAGSTGFCDTSEGMEEKGCVGAACSPGTKLGGTGFSVIGKSGWPLVAIEHVEHAGLGGLNDRRHRDALDFDVAQHRLRGEIVIPQIVMHELLVPHQLAALRIQRQERVGEAIAAEPRAAEEIGARGAGRDQDQAVSSSTDIRPQELPAPVVAAWARSHSAAAGCVGESGMGSNAHSSAPVAGIEGADDAALHVGRAVVADRGTDHHNIAVDGGRRGDQVVARSRMRRPLVRSTWPSVPKSLQGSPVAGIHCQQTRIQRAGEDPSRARTGSACCPDSSQMLTPREARFGVVARDRSI